MNNPEEVNAKSPIRELIQLKEEHPDIFTLLLKDTSRDVEIDNLQKQLAILLNASNFKEEELHDLVSTLDYIKKLLVISVPDILRGIEWTETESELGWWETSKGANFGKRKLDEVTNSIEEIINTFITNRNINEF